MLLLATFAHPTAAAPTPDRPIDDPPGLRVARSKSAKIPPIKLSPAVSELLGDAVTSAPQRRALRLFHGQWDDLGELSITEQAQLAYQRFDLGHRALADERVAKLLRARAALGRGEAAVALALVAGHSSVEALFIAARAQVELGRRDRAAAVLGRLPSKTAIAGLEDAAELTAAAEALALLARLEGRAAASYHEIMQLLGKAHGELDRLYWPAHLAEAALLMDKGNYPQASKAVIAALQLNPRCSEAWYHLGTLAVQGFRFDAAQRCVEKLQQIHQPHLLAELLATESALAQHDVAAARLALGPAIARLPQQRMVSALSAAIEALAFNQAGLDQALTRFDSLSPSNPLAYALVGSYLSAARQYESSEVMLRRAIELEPNWSQPRVTLGLMLMQAGAEERARVELAEAVRLDPFDVQAGNQLKLVEQLLGYEQIRSEHFIIKYRAGIDEVLARDMPARLEQIHRQVTGIFEFVPSRPTLIEIMPDEQYFAVRITGVPDIWTIAACSGDVIALTPPRIGARQRGTFDWPRVLRHEFTHTVTLNQTNYRIPHWFTEACAVAMEPGARDYATCKLLAAALKADELFDLSQINWAFVRPARPQDRPLAYGQAHWMLEYITTTFGHHAIVTMLGQFKQGATAEQALIAATGVDADQFMRQFKVWARTQVRQWGLGSYSQGNTTPDQLEAIARQALAADDAPAARSAVLRYANARPVDPWGQRVLKDLALAAGRTDEAIAALEHLDQQEQSAGTWAYQLAQLHRRAGRFDLAAGAAWRALYREPYNGTYRELAAAVALQRDENEAALHHIEALVMLEPERAIHLVRLAATYLRLNEPRKARAAAKAARKLDPEAPVARFLDR
jgi:tetratricopeptide (TPR) repeat protein